MTDLALTHDQVVHAIDRVMLGDPDPGQMRGAIIGVLTIHTTQPAPHPAPDPECEDCYGAGSYPVDGEQVHCHCRCPLCVGCGDAVCGGPCQTVAEIAHHMGNLEGS